jgi:tRNA-Thr(GGU) m(6)t(6)A37 methyltransferase TsaA
MKMIRTKLVPIGEIRTPFKTKDEAPIQGAYEPNTRGTVKILSKYAPGLKDIETFSHLYLIYQFDRSGQVKLVRETFLDDTPHGVFASRHPARPNGIGLTIVKLIKRNRNSLVVSGVDMLDRTPLLDIKPYVPRFDRQKNASNGWVSKVRLRKKPQGRE